jgi:hypothetical protein
MSRMRSWFNEWLPDESRALRPLHIEAHEEGEPPETFPMPSKPRASVTQLKAGSRPIYNRCKISGHSVRL